MNMAMKKALLQSYADLQAHYERFTGLVIGSMGVFETRMKAHEKQALSLLNALAPSIWKNPYGAMQGIRNACLRGDASNELFIVAHEPQIYGALRRNGLWPWRNDRHARAYAGEPYRYFVEISSIDVRALRRTNEKTPERHAACMSRFELHCLRMADACGKPQVVAALKQARKRRDELERQEAELG